MRRFGLTSTIRAGLLSATASLLINSRATQTWHFYVGQLAGCLPSSSLRPRGCCCSLRCRARSGFQERNGSSFNSSGVKWNKCCELIVYQVPIMMILGFIGAPATS
jgi:hypothetical protein